MKKAFSIDAKLIEEARTACGAETYTDTIRQGLEALVRHASYQRLRTFLGTEPHAKDVPRKRWIPRATKKRVAYREEL